MQIYTNNFILLSEYRRLLREDHHLEATFYLDLFNYASVFGVISENDFWTMLEEKGWARHKAQRALEFLKEPKFTEVPPYLIKSYIEIKGGLFLLNYMPTVLHDYSKTDYFVNNSYDGGQEIYYDNLDDFKRLRYTFEPTSYSARAHLAKTGTLLSVGTPKGREKAIKSRISTNQALAIALNKANQKETTPKLAEPAPEIMDNPTNDREETPSISAITSRLKGSREEKEEFAKQVINQNPALASDEAFLERIEGKWVGEAYKVLRTHDKGEYKEVEYEKDKVRMGKEDYHFVQNYSKEISEKFKRGEDVDDLVGELDKILNEYGLIGQRQYLIADTCKLSQIAYYDDFL